VRQCQATARFRQVNKLYSDRFLAVLGKKYCRLPALEETLPLFNFGYFNRLNCLDYHLDHEVGTVDPLCGVFYHR
jgi:hypothetical protein